MKPALLALVATLAGSTPTFAELCRIDPKRATYGPKSSVGGALICDGKNLDGMWAMISANQEIVGLSWRHHDGNKKERSIQIYETGELFFLLHDDNIQGGFSAKSRAVSRHVFPRDKKILVESNGQGIITVHDSAGNAWKLAVSQGKLHQSFEIVAINGKKQTNKPMDHSIPGIVGIDVAAFGPLVLIKNEPSPQNFADRRSPQYHKTKSVFVDPKGATCEVENKLLFGPSPDDPNDKFENVFLFKEDRSLRKFLDKQCAKLDVSILPQ